MRLGLIGEARDRNPARGALPERGRLQGAKMSMPFKGKINVDIRDSVPDWSPFEPAKAPDGAPNVIYAVLDDVGFSAMASYGGPVETPNNDRVVGSGVGYTQVHTTAVWSPARPCLPTWGNPTPHGMARLTQ